MSVGADIVTIYRGTDAVLTFTATGVTITGWAITFTVERTAAVAKVIVKPAAVTDGANGVFTVTLLAADTADLVPGDYQYDAFRTNAGSVTPLAVGIFRVADVARLPEVS
jgi:hypothetical protein